MLLIFPEIKSATPCGRIPVLVWVIALATFAAFQRPVLGQDCNNNGIDDACDLECGASSDPCDIPGCGASLDCNVNSVPDECELLSPETTFLDTFDSGFIDFLNWPVVAGVSITSNQAHTAPFSIGVGKSEYIESREVDLSGVPAAARAPGLKQAMG